MLKRNALIVIILLFSILVFFMPSYAKLLTSLNTSVDSTNLTYSGAGSETIYISLPKNVTVINASFNITGFQDDEYAFTEVGSVEIVTASNIRGIWNNATDMWFVDLTYNVANHSLLDGTPIGGFTVTSDPVGIAYNDSNIYVSDVNRKEINVYYGSNGTLFDTITVGGGFLQSPRGLSENGSHVFLFVRDQSNSTSQLYVYKTTDNTLDFTIPINEFTLIDNVNFGAVSYGPDDIWITDYYNGNIYKYNMDFSYSGTSLSIPPNMTYGLSTNDGINFYSTTNTAIHNFTLTGGGTPNNITIDISIDGDIEFNHTGDHTTENITVDFASEINDYLSTCTATDGNCSIPIQINSSTGGIEQIDSINIVYLEQPGAISIYPTDTYVDGNGDINFNCSATSDTDPLANISLFHNITGTWGLNDTTSVSGLTNHSNWSIFGIPDGKYIYACQSYNENNSLSHFSYSLTNYSFIVDTTIPLFQNSTENNTSPLYGETIKFEQNLSDANLDYYIFSSNYTGTWTNTSVDISGGTYWAIENATTTLTRGKTFDFYFWVNDTAGYNNTNSSGTITIANTAPTHDNPILNSTSATNKTTENLTCYHQNSNDADSDSMTYIYKWFNNTEIVNELENESVIYYANTTKNQKWICQVYITDGYNDSIHKNSTALNISNTAPVISTATINDSSPSETEDMSCLNGTTTDADGDSATLNYDWSKDGVWQNINSFNLTSGNTSLNELWKCRIYGDDGENNGSNITSASVQIGTGKIPPIINWTNATSDINNIASTSTNPTNNNTWLNLSVRYYDSNTDDLMTAYFCDTNSFNGNCSGTTLCSSLVNQSGNNLSCFYNTSGLSNGATTYYAFVVDNSSLESASVSNTFEINYPPNKTYLSYPIDGYYTNVNWTWLNYSSIDSDGDNINYTIYAGTDLSSLSLIYNGTSTSYNYSGFQNSLYYWKVTARDDHNYNSTNYSETFKFTYDSINPQLTVRGPENGTVYRIDSKKLSLLYTVEDINKQNCFFNIVGDVVGDTNYTNSSTIDTCPQTGTLDLSGYAFQIFTLKFYINDTAGNINTTTVIFNLSAELEDTTNTGGGGGAGSGGGLTPECYLDITCVEKYGPNYICVGNQCVLNQSALTFKESICGDGKCDIGKEDFISCQKDCPFDSEIFTSCLSSDPIKSAKCFWKRNYFSLLLLIILIFAIIYFAYKNKKKKKYKGGTRL